MLSTQLVLKKELSKKFSQYEYSVLIIYLRHWICDQMNDSLQISNLSNSKTFTKFH